MKFVFWQNIVSIHQSAFIKALASNHDVTLVAEEGLDSQRVTEKWEIPSMGEAKILVSPSPDEVEELLSVEETINVFSGIDAYPLVYRAFKRAVALDCAIVVMAEPYDWTGLKGKLRHLKYRWLFLRYGNHIRHFFTTGNMGMLCYKNAGFSERKLHQWGYFTEQVITPNHNHGSSNKPNLIFVGKIDERKNILTLVDTALENENLFNKFLIVGTGPLLPELKEKIDGHKSISHLGVLPNEDVMSLISQSDLLVLPSLFDGWGAVVNEALGKGTRVLCSDMCGAGILLDNDKRGGCFRLKDPDDLRNKLKFWLCRGPLTAEERVENQQWANKNISGEAASRYFCETLNNDENETIIAPWVSPPR
ncbi:MAG: glycosyltransferase [Muribaculaceae bacterium]|nr:glycosyltransferase [Muribaculaceae bacterium]